MTKFVEARQAPLCVAPDVEAPSQPGHHRRCKILCTMGCSSDVNSLERLLDEGVDAFCLDFCYEWREAHAESLHCIRQMAAARGREVAVILELRGPEVRTGFLKDCQSVHLEAGNRLTLMTDMSVEGDAEHMAIDLEQLPGLLQAGDVLLLADGSISLEVLAASSGEIVTRILNSGRLGARSNCWLQGLQDLPDAPEDAFRGIVVFGIPQEVDFVAASCARSGQDVRHLREVLGERGRHIGVLAKIGCEAGLQNVDEILRESDGIIIASGDLGMRIPQEKVFLAQKAIIAKCNMAGKPVIVASQTQESTRGCRDFSAAAHAVLDGVDGVLLSDATALRDFPEAAAATLRRTCEAAEVVMDRGAWHSSALVWQPEPVQDSPEAAALEAVEAARSKHAALLMVLTVTGQLAHAVSRLRPTMHVLAVTSSRRTARKLQVLRGVSPLLLEDLPEGAQAAMGAAMEAAEEGAWVRKGDVVVTAMQGDVKDNSTSSAYKIESLVVGGGVLAAAAPSQESHEVEGYRLAQPMVFLEDKLEGLASFEEVHQVLPCRCKIMCTVGPKSWSIESLLRLIDAGMNVCRLDSASVAGDLSILAACVKRVRYAAALRRDRTIAVQLDVDVSHLRQGRLETQLSMDLQAVDYLAIRAEDAADVRRAREAWGPISKGTLIVAKIASKTGLRNFDEILHESDGILVARSELGLEISAEKAFLIQKMLIGKCNVAGKPVVTSASLTSMSEAPRPTPAEASALANAVLDGADCVALEDETAVGKFAEVAVKAVRRLCEEVAWALGAAELDGESLEAKPAVQALQLARRSGADILALECMELGEALEVARLRPGLVVLAVTRDERLARQLAVVQGVAPIWVEPSAKEKGMEVAMQMAIMEARRRQRLCNTKAAAVLLRGSEVKLAPDCGDGLEDEDLCLCGMRRLQQAAPEFAHLAQQALSTPNLASGAVAQAAGCLSARIHKATAAATAAVVGSLKAQVQSRQQLASPRQEFGKRFLEENQERCGVVVLPSGLQYKVLRKGEGKGRMDPEVACLCHYEGYVAQHWPTGPAFVSTYSNEEPQELKPSEVIPGLAEAMQMMAEGDQWVVYIPPALGYGQQGSPPHVEGGDVLIFAIELTGPQPAAASEKIPTPQLELDRRRLRQVPTPRYVTGFPSQGKARDPSPCEEDDASEHCQKVAPLSPRFENEPSSSREKVSLLSPRLEEDPSSSCEKVPTPQSEKHPSPRDEKEVLPPLFHARERSKSEKSLPTFMDEKQEAFLRSTQSVKELARRIGHLNKQVHDVTSLGSGSTSPTQMTSLFPEMAWPSLERRQKPKEEVASDCLPPH